MRVLVSAVGTRGDVQPAIALAQALRGEGAQVRLCVPPNFTDWASEFGFEARPIGIAMRPPAPGEAPAPIPDLIADQFQVVEAAAEGCELIVGAGIHQYAVRSVAERNDVRSVVAAYAPVSLPSALHAPPPSPVPGAAPPPDQDPWDAHRAGWNARSLDRVNAGRARLGLAPITDVLGHILGEAPWLAADPALGPAPADLRDRVVQTGAWMLADTTPLPPELEAFLAGGEAPIYVGFGSMPAAADKVARLLEAARAVGRRVILSRGWAQLGDFDGADRLVVGEVNHAALFGRVAAVIHHGGAGTTAAAAAAGAPQVIAPMFSDQFYWAGRVTALGLGAQLSAITAEATTGALDRALAAGPKARAFAPKVSRDGAAEAARRLLAA